MADFTDSKYFTKNENWGDPDRLDQRVLDLMNALRHWMECKIIIHCAVEKDGHSTTGYHPKAMAVDFHLDTDIDFKTQYLLIEEFFRVKAHYDCGMGVYPYWNSKGFHIDVRGYKARWMRNKENEFVAINIDEL